MLSAKKAIMLLNSRNSLIENPKKFQDEKLGKKLTTSNDLLKEGLILVAMIGSPKTLKSRLLTAERMLNHNFQKTCWKSSLYITLPQ